MKEGAVAANSAELISSVELFADLAGDELEQLATFTSPFELAPGEVLLHRGERTDSIFLIADGLLEVLTRGPNGWINVGQVGPNEIAGEMALLTGEQRSATLRAVVRTWGVAIGRDVIDSLRRSHRPGGLMISRHLAAIACNRIRRRLDGFAGDSRQAAHRTHAVAAEVPCEPDGLPHVASLPWFSALGGELASVLDHGHWIRVTRGSILALPGDVPPAIYVPTRGALEELLDAGDRRYRTRLAGPGRAAANLGVVDDGASPTTIRALERAIVFALPRSALREIWEGRGRMTRALLSAVTEDLAGAIVAANAPHPWERRH